MIINSKSQTMTMCTCNKCIMLSGMGQVSAITGAGFDVPDNQNVQLAPTVHNMLALKGLAYLRVVITWGCLLG